MKCEIIRDLLPSYLDELTSAESNQAIEEHLQECKDCRKHLEAISGCTGSMMQAPSTISRSRYFIKNLPGISLL